jgi:exodeoxyribonuclease-3
VRIATFNINGVGARLPRLLEWLERTRPDVACLQEIKCQTEAFPVAAVEAAGYRALVHGQKGFNGVAILSREPAGERLRALPGDDEDAQSRYIEAETGNGLIVGGLYLPNGNPAPGPKFAYKLAWFERIAAHARDLMALERPVVLIGDWNVCPTAEDVFSERAMAGDALIQPESRAAFRRLLNAGWTDAIRARQPSGLAYTFWDYQAGAWPRDHGLRIDHALLSPHAADRLRGSGVDREERGRERASDHAPVWVELAA